MKVFKDAFPCILQWSDLKKGNIPNVLMYLLKEKINVQKGLSSISSCVQFGPKCCFENRVYSYKQWGNMGKEVEISRCFMRALQILRKHAAVSCGFASPSSNPSMAVLCFVSKGQAGTLMMCLLSVSAAICSKLPHYVEDPIKCASEPPSSLLKDCLCRITSHQHSRAGLGPPAL